MIRKTEQFTGTLFTKKDRQTKEDELAKRQLSQLTPKKASREITFWTFVDWTWSCGARECQRQYDLLLAEAKLKGISITEALRIKGFYDAHHFRRSCNRFPLFCWPTRFAELGMGYVMYFHMLAFLIITMFMLFIVQSPALIEYSKHRNTWMWYVDIYDSSDPCACTGFSYQGKGAACKQWDLSCASDIARCNFSTPGTWMCNSWCYASYSTCAVDIAATQDSADRAVLLSGKQYVRSYSACIQVGSNTTKCSGAKNCSYAEPDVLAVPSGLDWNWLTPGNYGPGMATDRVAPTMYLFCSFFLGIMILLMHQLQLVMVDYMDLGTSMPSDFAVLVKGLPRELTDEKLIADFFSYSRCEGTVN